MLERATFVTTTGTGPRAAPLPPPRPPLPPPWPLGPAFGWPARHTAYPATPATISRKTTQISPRFFDLRGLGGVGPCWPGKGASGSGSDVSVFVVIIQAAYRKAADFYNMTDLRASR